MISFSDLRKKGGLLPLEVNSGVQIYQQNGYFIPKSDWRSLTQSEARRITARSASIETISLLTLPDSLSTTFDARIKPELLLASEAARSLMLREFADAVLDQLSKEGISCISQYTHELVINEPNQPSTAYNHQDGRFVGLHIDTHQARSFEDRKNKFHICGLNLGKSERYLQFMDLNAEEIVEKIGNPSLSTNMRALVSTFLTAFPDYPVYRLCLQPGEAYLAPTQFALHDGSTNQRGLEDIAFFLAGHFEVIG